MSACFCGPLEVVGSGALRRLHDESYAILINICDVQAQRIDYARYVRIIGAVHEWV